MNHQRDSLAAAEEALDAEEGNNGMGCKTLRTMSIRARGGEVDGGCGGGEDGEAMTWAMNMARRTSFGGRLASPRGMLRLSVRADSGRRVVVSILTPGGGCRAPTADEGREGVVGPLALARSDGVDMLRPAMAVSKMRGDDAARKGPGIAGGLLPTPQPAPPRRLLGGCTQLGWTTIPLLIDSTARRTTASPDSHGSRSAVQAHSGTWMGSPGGNGS